MPHAAVFTEGDNLARVNLSVTFAAARKVGGQSLVHPGTSLGVCLPA